MKKAILIGLLSLLASSAFAQRVTSPDGKWVVFVKPGSGPMIETGIDSIKPTELGLFYRHAWRPGAEAIGPALVVTETLNTYD